MINLRLVNCLLLVSLIFVILQPTNQAIHGNDEKITLKKDVLEEVLDVAAETFSIVKNFTRSIGENTICDFYVVFIMGPISVWTDGFGGGQRFLEMYMQPDKRIRSVSMNTLIYHYLKVIRKNILKV